MYQGHMNDGSSIQKHSAGHHFPFVVYAKQCLHKLNWGVSGMGTDSGPIFWDEETARHVAQRQYQQHVRKVDRLRAERKVHADPMIRMSTELLGYVWAPDVKGIPIIHTRRVQADRKAEWALWAQRYCDNNQDLPVAVIADGLRMQGYSRHEISTAITAYVMGVV